LLEDYRRFGFEPQAQVIASGARFTTAHRAWTSRPGWLYAFVSDGRVMYVGLTINPLGARVDQYRHGGDQCARVRQHIVDELAAGREVWLYGRPVDDREEMQREEARLRRDFKPPWNRA